MNIQESEEILDKACLICGRKNRYHRVFWSPYYRMFMRQNVSDDEAYEPLVSSADHYTCLDNLEYLEYLYARSSR